MAQFKIERRDDRRLDIALPVLLTGIAVNGHPVKQEVMTINISRQGALLEGVHEILRAGDKVFLSRLQKKEQYLIAWVGGKDKPAGQIGVSAVDADNAFWDDVLGAAKHPALEKANMPGNNSRPRASQTNAAGAGR